MKNDNLNIIIIIIMIFGIIGIGGYIVYDKFIASKIDEKELYCEGLFIPSILGNEKTSLNIKFKSNNINTITKIYTVKYNNQKDYEDWKKTISETTTLEREQVEFDDINRTMILTTILLSPKYEVTNFYSSTVDELMKLGNYEAIKQDFLKQQGITCR